MCWKTCQFHPNVGSNVLQGSNYFFASHFQTYKWINETNNYWRLYLKKKNFRKVYHEKGKKDHRHLQSITVQTLWHQQGLKIWSWKSDTSGMTFKYLSITQYFYHGNETWEFSSLMKRRRLWQRSHDKSLKSNVFSYCGSFFLWV